MFISFKSFNTLYNVDLATLFLSCAKRSSTVIGPLSSNKASSTIILGFVIDTLWSAKIFLELFIAK